MPRFSTTLTADMGAADLIISVASNTGAPTTYPARFFIEDECIAVVGGVAEGLDWDIRRGAEGTDPVGHASAAGVRFTPPGDGTSIIYDWGAFTAASVVAEGSGDVIATSFDGAGDMAAQLTLLGVDGTVTLEGVAGAGAFVIEADGTTRIAGTALSFFVGADGGSDGEVLVGRNADNNVAWQQITTVQTGAPSTYQTPLVFDDTAITGGLYSWNGTAYVQIGGPL